MRGRFRHLPLNGRNYLELSYAGARQRTRAELRSDEGTHRGDFVRGPGGPRRQRDHRRRGQQRRRRRAARWSTFPKTPCRNSRLPPIAFRQSLGRSRLHGRNQRGYKTGHQQASRRGCVLRTRQRAAGIARYLRSQHWARRRRFIASSTQGISADPFRQDKAWWFVAMEDRQQLGADLVGVRNTATPDHRPRSSPPRRCTIF